MSTTRREFIKTVGAAIATSQIPPEPAAMDTLAVRSDAALRRSNPAENEK